MNDATKPKQPTAEQAPIIQPEPPQAVKDARALANARTPAGPASMTLGDVAPPFATAVARVPAGAPAPAAVAAPPAGPSAYERGVTTMREQLAAPAPAPTSGAVYSNVGFSLPSLPIGKSAPPTVRAMEQAGAAPSASPASGPSAYDRGVTTMQGQLAEPAASFYTTRGPTDPDVNGRPPAPASSPMFGPSDDHAALRKLYGPGAYGEDGRPMKAEVAQPVNLDPFANRQVSPAPAAKPATPAPAAEPPAPAGAAPAAAGGSEPSLPELLAAQQKAEAPATGEARSFVMPNGQKMFTNLTDDAAAIAGLSAKNGMPSPGTAAGNPNLGSAQDNLRQLENIRALSTPMPAPGAQVAVLDNGTDAANAEKTKRWAIDDMMAKMGKAGTRTERAAMGQAINTMLAGDNQQAVAAVQAETQRRGQDVAAQTAAAGHGVQMRGQDIGAQTAAGQLGLGMRRLTVDTENSAADRATRLQIAQMGTAVDEKKLEVLKQQATAKGDDVEWKQDLKTGLYYNAKAKNPQLFDIGMIAQRQNLAPAK